MEREFLLGIDFGLYVDKATYVSWLNLLKGLVMAKERDSRHWRRSPRAHVTAHSSKTHRSAAQRAHHATRSQRARSSSPRRPVVYALSSSPQHQVAPPAIAVQHTPPRANNKRSAADAFSPTSATFAPIKQAKRPSGLTLDIPEHPQGSVSGHSISPSEPLQSFAKLSIGASPSGIRPVTADKASPAWPSTVRQNVVPQTLASAYHVDERRTYAAPQVCSPLHILTKVFLITILFGRTCIFILLRALPRKRKTGRARPGCGVTNHP